MTGDLTVKSEIGRGSMFTLTLPVDSPAVVVDAGHSITPPASMIVVPDDAVPLHRVRM
jgi:hypothetical protein